MRAVHAVHLLCREYMEIPSASKNIIHGSLQGKHEINIVKSISKFPKTYIHFICKVILLYLANSLLQCKSTIFLPSAMKLRRLCFYRCVSVHRGGGGAWSRGEGGVFSGDAGWVPGLGGCLV